MLTTVEKVILLQAVEAFEFAPTESLAHIAAITDEVEEPEGRVLFGEGDAPDAMYLVVSGTVRIEHDGSEVATVGEREVFGAWGLLDDAPRMVRAVTAGDCRLLRIDRNEFRDLLADNILVTESVMKSLTRRLRRLVRLSEPHEPGSSPSA